MNVFRKRLRAEFGKKVYRHFVSLCKEELDQKKNKTPEEQIKANEKVVYSEMCEQIQSLTKEEIEKAARENGTKLLRDNASALVQAGQSSIDELIRTTYTV